jgi:hypothetical protein
MIKIDRILELCLIHRLSVPCLCGLFGFGNPQGILAEGGKEANLRIRKFKLPRSWANASRGRLPENNPCGLPRLGKLISL